jgi:hypothetical protein
MNSSQLWETLSLSNSQIAGERRKDRRYPLRLGVKWNLIRRRRVLDSGVGQTIDLSSGGILFYAGREMPEGLKVELSITWPVMLHDVAPLQLVSAGRIVRSNSRQVAFQMTTHEFRTVGTPADQRGAEANPKILRFLAK